MGITVEAAVIPQSFSTEEKQVYSVEEACDRIDTKFIDFYGEYGRKIVNARRTEWNQDGVVHVKSM
jgi:2-methylisocitrate lyase-like PEP mutase family enzyme